MQDATVNPAKRGQHTTYWNEIRPGDHVEVSLQNATEDHGTVDCVSDDGTVLWVWLEGVGQRTLLHHLDNVYVRLSGNTGNKTPMMNSHTNSPHAKGSGKINTATDDISEGELN